MEFLFKRIGSLIMKACVDYPNLMILGRNLLISKKEIIVGWSGVEVVGFITMTQANFFLVFID